MKIPIVVISILCLAAVVFYFSRDSEGTSEKGDGLQASEKSQNHVKEKSESKDSFKSGERERNTEDDDLISDFATLLREEPEQAILKIAEDNAYRAYNLSQELSRLLIARFEDSEFSFDEVSNLLRPLESTIPDVMFTVGNRLCSHWHSESPEEVRKWMLEQGDSPLALSSADWYGQMLGGQEDPSEESLALIAKAETPVAAKLLTHILDAWIIRAPDEALDFMGQFDDQPIFDQAIASYAIKNVEVAPATAMTWAEALHDEGKRLSAMAIAAEVWKHQDPEAYQVWYEKVAVESPALKEVLDNSVLGGPLRQKE